MTYFIFTDSDGTEITGTDQLFRPDNRYLLSNQLQHAKKQAQRLKNVKPGITGVNVYTGTLKNSSFRGNLQFNELYL